MAPRDTPPYRADHVGSLLRPPQLLQAREDFKDGRIDADELRGIEDEAIRDVVRKQEEVGLRSATDGEFRRASWHMDFIYQLGGVTRAQESMKVQFHNAEGDIEFTPAALHVDAPIALQEPIFAEDFRFTQSCVTRATPKLTIPSPSMVHYRGGRASIDEDVYPDMDAFWDDLTSAYAAEVRALAGLGCTYLQFDDTSLAYLNDPKQRQMIESMGGDGEHQHELYIRHINEALEERPDGMAVTTHMCPRQLPLVVGRRGRLRLRRRGALQRARGRRLLHGVGRRALGWLRAAALRPQGQAGRARPRDDEAAAARVEGRPQAPDRGGLAVRRPRPALPVAAVRLLLDGRGQRAHLRRPGGEAAA